MTDYIIQTSATMKPYNHKKWWIDSNIISDKYITAETITAALQKYCELVASTHYIEITANALKNKSPMYVDTVGGEVKQVGYVITAKTEFQDDCGKWSNQYIDLWIKIITTTETNFDD